MKNYVGFANDHSGSISSLRHACASDYNATITAIKDAASREMLDTVVSVVGIGIGENGYGVKRQVVISNPHVLKPVQSWQADGGTPLYDGIGNLIELFESLPDYNSPDVSFLVMTTTDGEEQHSRKYTLNSLSKKIKELQNTGRWTFVFRVPKGASNTVAGLGVPLDNIQEWETTIEGMAKSTTATTQAVDAYYATRSLGAKSSTVFYANAKNVNAATLATALKDISSDVSLYVVPDNDSGIQIRDFIHKHRAEYLKGSAFYQLTKTEPRVSDKKLIAIRDRTTGKIYSGAEARNLIGLPIVGNARLHPGDHGNYDLFIQSESVNRKLVGGTGVLYWKAIGVPFKPEDTAYLNVAKPAVVTLPAVAPTNKPTPSPLTPTKKSTKQFYASRDAARASGKPVKDAGKTAANGQRWYVEL